MSVRIAEFCDFSRLHELCLEMHKEGSFSSMDFSPEICMQTVFDYIKSDGGLALVAVNDKKYVVGMFLGCISQSFFGKDIIASDTLLYVDKEHRGGFHGASMIKKFVEWSKLSGAKQIRPGVSTGDEVASKVYERLGFKNVGLNFCLEV